MKFKIFYKDEVRRFCMNEESISWYKFTEALRELFTSHSDFHKELTLQYEDAEGDKINISTEVEFDEMLQQHNRDALIKLRITEGNGNYFKDGEITQLRIYQHVSPLSGKYQTFLYDSEKGMYHSWLELSILGDNTIMFGPLPLSSPHFTSPHVVEWQENENEDDNNDNDNNNNDDNNNNNIICDKKQNSNYTSGKLTFSEKGAEFEGWISFAKQIGDVIITDNFFTIPLNVKINIKGMKVKQIEGDERERDHQYLHRISTSLPQFLRQLFPDGQILPNHLPDWLKPCVKSSFVQNDAIPEMDLDFDLEKLYVTLHQKGLDFLDASQYSSAEQFIKMAIEISPFSTNAHYNLACVYSRAGDLEKAIEELKFAITDCNYSNLSHMLSDSDLSNLHPTNEFQLLVEKLL